MVHHDFNGIAPCGLKSLLPCACHGFPHTLPSKMLYQSMWKPSLKTKPGTCKGFIHQDHKCLPYPCVCWHQCACYHGNASCFGRHSCSNSSGSVHVGVHVGVCRQQVTCFESQPCFTFTSTILPLHGNSMLYLEY